MFFRIINTFVFISLILILLFCQKTEHTDNKIPASSSIRGVADTVGFSFTEDQIKAVVQLSERLEHKAIQENQKKYGNEPWIAAICPHDDHLLAGRVYVHLFQNLKAKQLIIFGVAHKAGKWGAQDSIIFDSFDYWRGPYGYVPVSETRNEIISLLPDSIYVVNNDWQSEEHSVEGIVPFIQHYIPDAKIVSILVPYMNWERIELISEHLANALAIIIQKNQWEPGKDIAFICSNDGDHYGDQDWGGRNLAPFGADENGYLKATHQDSQLILTTLSGKLKSEKLKDFCDRVWGENDLKEYKIRWCGRFAIPFGLNTVRKLMEKLNQKTLNGYLLRYDTSYNLGKLPLDNIGIGTTAPNNIHHWIGYSVIGYR